MTGGLNRSLQRGARSRRSAGVCHQCLTGPAVEGDGDPVEVFLAVAAQAGAFGEVLAQQAVGVLVGAALPGAVGVAEVDRDAGRDGEVTRGAAISGPWSQVRDRHRWEGSRATVSARAAATVSAFGVGDLGQHDVTGRPLDQGGYVAFCCPCRRSGRPPSARARPGRASAGRSEIMTMSIWPRGRAGPGPAHGPAAAQAAGQFPAQLAPALDVQDL